MAESEYDRLTRRSIEAKRRLDQAEEYLQNPGRDGGQAQWSWRVRRDRALKEYLEIEAERKRAAPPPAFPADED
ncbi:MAG: hypothetical protein AB7I59_08040 [Geminicoccaceae bacterium]